jgi:aerobic-type carbon monoxide dehydrogenase small subunit (CoxS/CutS family)
VADSIVIVVNGTRREVAVEPDTPLLWVLRDHLALTGTKYGCGAGLCGACTVLVDGRAVRSCQVRADAVKGSVTTIEGLSSDGTHPVQRAWIAERVPQCGYCQAGQILAAAALLREIPRPSDTDIEAHVGNLCRCGTYARVRRAIRRAARQK